MVLSDGVLGVLGGTYKVVCAPGPSLQLKQLYVSLFLHFGIQHLVVVL